MTLFVAPSSTQRLAEIEAQRAQVCDGACSTFHRKRASANPRRQDLT
ncbi:MAG: hypothetical protein JNM17_05520 [Archangium sp.]|nr:hypothetical protein [Archangium sp.]